MTPSTETRSPIPLRAVRRRRTAAAVAAVVASVTVAACGSSSKNSSSTSSSSSAAAASSTTSAAASASSGKTVTLKIGDQAGTGAQALLTAAGLINKLPFPVKWADFTSGPPIVQAINAGSLDIGGVGNAPPVFAAAGGAKIVIVGATADNPGDDAILVPKGSSITSVSQLKGKKIAVAQGSSGNANLLAELNKSKIGVKDVSFDYLQPADGLAALSSKAVDAWDVWPPFVQEAEAKGAKPIATNVGIPGNYSYVVASNSAVANLTVAKEIQEYLNLLRQATDWEKTHYQAWATAWGKATALPTSIMLKAAANDTQTPVPVNATIISAEQALVNEFATAGLIPKQYSFTPYVSTAFNGALQ